MATELDELVRTIVEDAAATVLRPAGSARRGRRFWRSRSEVEHLVIFERQSVFDKGVTELWVTAAVFVPGYFELRYPPFREPKRSRIKPTDCVVWATTDSLVADAEPPTSPKDWRIDLNSSDDQLRELADDIKHCLANGAVPFLDLFNTPGDIITLLTHPRSGLGASAHTSEPLHLEAAAVLYALLGKHDRAVEQIDLAIRKTKVAEARTHQHTVREAINRHCTAKRGCEP